MARCLHRLFSTSCSCTWTSPCGKWGLGSGCRPAHQDHGRGFLAGRWRTAMPSAGGTAGDFAEVLRRNAYGGRPPVDAACVERLETHVRRLADRARGHVAKRFGEVDWQNGLNPPTSSTNPKSSGWSTSTRWGPGGSTALEVTPSESERAALARRFGFLGLPAFSARATVDRRAGGQVVVEGRLRGKIVQACILTSTRYPGTRRDL